MVEHGTGSSAAEAGEPLALTASEQDYAGGQRGETFKEGGLQQLHAAAALKTEEPAAAACRARLLEFEEIVAPLERECGKQLGGPGLELCRTAFRQNPHGFRLCAADALRRATSNPLGLLVRMVRDGDHRDVAPPSAPSSTSFQRAEQWVRNAGCQLEPADFVDELAHRFPALDDLAHQRLSRLYDQRRAGAAREGEE